MTGRNSQTADLLGLPTMRATGSDAGGGNDFTTIRVEITQVTTACLHCGKSALTAHGVVEQAVVDTPRTTSPPSSLTRRRLLCAGCRKTFFEEAPDIDPKRLATRRLVEFVEQHGLHLTFMEVAEQWGFVDSTRAPAPTRIEIAEEVEALWLGAHIPTICDLLDKAYFE